MTRHLTPVPDWPEPTSDFYANPMRYAHGDDRETLEQLTIAALCWVKNPAHRQKALSILSATFFRHGKWRTCFEVISALDADRRQINVIELTDELDRRGNLADVGGMVTICSLIEAPFPGGFPHQFAEVLADWARKDRLTEVAKSLTEEAKKGSIDVDAALAALTPVAINDRHHGIDRVDDVRAEVHARSDHMHAGLMTGFKALDWHYRVCPELLTVVTGHPGSGKSTVVDNIAYKMASRYGWTFAIFSAESAPTARHARRLAGLFAGRPADSMSSDELDGALDIVKAHVEWINSNDNVDVAEVLRCADVIHRTRPIQGLIIDPWNELDHTRPPHITETQHISACLTAIRRWARRRGVHVWIVAHPTKLPRKSDGTYDAPTLYDVSGSSTWYDKADMGLVVMRDKSLNVSPTTIHIVKVRFQDDGKLGSVRLGFEPRCERFADIEERRV